MTQSLKKFIFLFFCYIAFVFLFFSFDKTVLNFFISLRRDWLTDIMRAVTFLGDVKFILPVSVALLVWFWLSKRFFYFLFLAFSVSVSAGLVFLLKDFFVRVRPAIESRLVSEDSFSFPSGHAMMAIAFWGALAYLFAENFPKGWQKIIVAVGGAGLIFF